jgi:hypothetical protein
VWKHFRSVRHEPDHREDPLCGRPSGLDAIEIGFRTQRIVQQRDSPSSGSFTLPQWTQIVTLSPCSVPTVHHGVPDNIAVCPDAHA